MQTIKIIKPDDWHLHLRDGEMLKSVLKMTAAQMGRAIIMPNLSPPICDLKAARAYKNEIIHALPEGNNFTPLMVLYLTDNTSPAQIEEAAKSPEVVAAKLYPAGATTNSDAGVSDIINIYPVLEALQKQQMPLLVHGEVVREDVDIFDREAVFIDEVLSKIIRDFPDLKVVFEHISTKQAADFVLENNSNIAATITAHHLLANRNDMLKGGINPHLFCLPILKSRNPHQLALLDAAISGNPKFFLGTDSAPHEQSAKQSACGCAGIFTAGTAIELYATAFDEQNALDKLESFASIFGADFYNLPHNTTTITLKKSPQTIPTSYPTPTSKIIPFWPGKTLNWQLNNSTDEKQK